MTAPVTFIPGSATSAPAGPAGPAAVIVRTGAPEREHPEVPGWLTEVTVTCSRSAAATATLVLTARRDADGRWPVQDSELFVPWSPIILEVAFGSRREPLLYGYVRELRADYPPQTGAATVTVVAQDRTLALDRAHVRRVWGASSPDTGGGAAATADGSAADGVIVSSILGEHRGIMLHPDNAEGMSNVVLAQDCTDIRFLRERAAANGYECYLAGETLYFGPPRLTVSPQPALIVAGGAAATCTSFTVAADGHRPEAVAVQLCAATGTEAVEHVIRSALPLLGARPAVGADVGLPGFVWRLRHLPAIDEQELVARARGAAEEQSMRVRAQAQIDGTRYGHVLRVGEPVQVTGAGDRFSGAYYVDEVTHRLTAEGYRQSATLLRNAYGEGPGSG